MNSNILIHIMKLILGSGLIFIFLQISSIVKDPLFQGTFLFMAISLGLMLLKPFFNSNIVKKLEKTLKEKNTQPSLAGQINTIPINIAAKSDTNVVFDKKTRILTLYKK